MKALRLFAIWLAASALLGAGISLAAEQRAQTGSRIKGGEADQPTTIIRFDEPGELAEIRRLLAEGEIVEARKVADGLLKADRSAYVQYAGHNAKCAVETQAGRYDAAMAACDAAISIRPFFWMALNSRGTVHLMAGRPEAALRDYRTALAAVSDDSPTAEIIRHNIEIAQQRSGGTS